MISAMVIVIFLLLIASAVFLDHWRKQKGKESAALPFWRRRPVTMSLLLAIAVGVVGSLVYLIYYACKRDFAVGPGDIFFIVFLFSFFVGFLVFYPGFLTIMNLIGLVVLPREENDRRALLHFEWITILLGGLYSACFAGLSDICFGSEWSEQLYNAQIHQPIWSDGLVAVVLIALAAVLGYLVLAGIPLRMLPPLAAVLSMAAMYLGIAECILWCVQIFSTEFWVLCVFPLNCVIIALKTVRLKVTEWNELHSDANVDYEKQPSLSRMARLLNRSEWWPLLAFVLMWPLFGLLLCILLLFGTKPDVVIKAWTETAQWRLSARTALPNLYYDEHYLCTVAAGGHEKIVKPLRMGERHGHRVVVNRQLCIANAFEQILEERTPRFHRAVRHFYDTYGFPVARLIRTKTAADVVYFMMKPLEWIFLAVLYLCDVNPENRIAVQYLPQRGND